MRAAVDLDKCDGYANCVVEADAIFDLDLDSGNAVVLVDPIPPDLVEQARAAVDSCPVSAISLVED